MLESPHADAPMHNNRGMGMEPAAEEGGWDNKDNKDAHHSPSQRDRGMENFTFISKIAEGAYGTVWRCVENSTQKEVAIKKLKDVTAVGSEASNYLSRGRACC